MDRCLLTAWLEWMVHTIYVCATLAELQGLISTLEKTECTRYPDGRHSCGQERSVIAC